MSTHAAGTFEIESWDEQPYEEQDGTRLTRTRLTKTFSGDVEGESAAELLMAYGSEEGSAAYVGLERVTGSVHGRPGSFVLHHGATMKRGEGEARLSAVSGSATCELRGPRGGGCVAVAPEGGRSFTLDHDFG